MSCNSGCPSAINEKLIFFPVLNQIVNCLQNLYSLALVTSIKKIGLLQLEILKAATSPLTHLKTGLKIAVVFHLVSIVLDCFSPATQ